MNPAVDCELEITNPPGALVLASRMHMTGKKRKNESGKVHRRALNEQVGKSVLGQSLCRVGAEMKIDSSFKPSVQETKFNPGTKTKLTAVEKNDKKLKSLWARSAGIDRC
jgi:hypothetical protein